MIQCQNKNLFLSYDEKKSEIISIKHGDKEYIASPIPVLTLCLRDQKGNKILISSSELDLVEAKGDEKSFCASYENDLVQITLGATISSEITWSLHTTVSNDKVIEWINYPSITVENNLSKDPKGHKLLWGFNEGVLLDNIDDREKTYHYMEPEYPSKGLMGVYPGVVETQFMAYFNCEDGLYFGAHDSLDFFKGVDFYRHENGGIFLQFRHFCGGDFGEEYTLPYPMVMDFFQGGWEDAAEIYRSWFSQNNNFVPIAENQTLPDWYQKSPVVITYPVRGEHDADEKMEPNRMFPYCNVLPHVKRLEQELQSPIMVLLMHWEGTAPWAPPVVWPPYGGEEELKKLIDALHQRGDVLGVYCSGIGWTLKSNMTDFNTEEDFIRNHLAQEMCLSPEQTLPYSEICTGQRVGYDLCPTREFTINTVKEQVSFMAKAGIDYIQLLDQNHGGTSYFCYSKSHGHPPVPGKWQVDAMKHLLEEVIKQAPDTLFGCESAAAQSYIPYLQFSDNRYHLNYFFGQPVPVYAYLYHAYVNNFMGNQVCAQNILDHEKSPVNLLERISYSFLAGDMLMLVLDQDGVIQWNWGMRDFSNPPEQQPVKELIRNLNVWRQGAGKKYLHTGTMVKPFEISCEENVYFRKYVGPISRKRIHTSAWHSIEGSYGQFLINYNIEDTSCTVSLPQGQYRLTDHKGKVTKIFGGEVPITITKLSAILLERENEHD